MTKRNFELLRRSCSILLFFCVLCASPVAAQMVSVEGDSVNMRSGPGLNYKVLWDLGNGFPLMVVKKKGEWLQVKDFEGAVGWVHKKVVNSTGHMIVKVNKDSKERINIRSGPGTNYDVVAKAHYGVVFKTLKQQKGWVHVEHEQGVRGWVNRKLVWGW